MAYLAINGYELPPCKRGVSVVVTTVVDSGRDANGAVVGQRVGRDQYKMKNMNTVSTSCLILSSISI